MPTTKPNMYKNGTDTTVGGGQLNPHAWERKALIQAREEQYFGQLSATKDMPKHSGKTLKVYNYIPILDDRNVNELGIDASGAKYANGNLYGSSKDIGTIPDKMPVLSELGGRVNRVGITRTTIEGSIQKLGFFTDYSQELMDFDSDADLMEHINRELLNAAVTITEDLLQIDLLNNAGTIYYTGTATQKDQLSKDMDLTYSDLMNLSIALDNARTPKHTKIITGTRLIDTKTLASCRVAYVGSELIPTLEAMKDLHDRPAFVPVNQYASGTTVLKGERGAIGEFRIVVVPRMMKWAGKGAGSADSAYHATSGNYDVFPFLSVGSESFSDIGFQTNGKENKFKIIHKKPSKETADKTDPYGETGFISIKWWYGTIFTRPERIGLILCTAKM